MARLCIRSLSRPIAYPAYIWSFGLLECLLVFTSSCSAQAASDALSKVTALVRAGHYDAAIIDAERALRTDPSDPRLRTVEGLAYSMRGDNADALQALRKTLRITPGFLPALKAEAQILTREHNPDAIPVLKEILKQTSQDNTAREMLAIEQAHSGSCAAALKTFAALAPAARENQATLLSHAACLSEEKRFAEAVPVFAQLAGLHPTSVDLRYDLALTQFWAGQNQAADDTLTSLLATDADLDSLMLASDVYESLGDTPRAIAALRQAIVLQPTEADAYVRFAELCMLHESYQAGVAMVSAGIARLPHNSPLYLARGMLYGGVGEYDKAEADFRLAEIYDARHGTGAYGVGLVEAQRNDPEQALATTRAALRTHPDDAQLNFLLARLLIQQGEQPGTDTFREATRCDEKAVRLRPDLLSARNLLAKIYSLSGQTEQAIAQCRAVLAIDPSDQTAMYRLLMASRKAGDIATAHALSQQLADEHQRARDQESHRLHYRIVEANGPGGLPAATAPGRGQP